MDGVRSAATRVSHGASAGCLRVIGACTLGFLVFAGAANASRAPTHAEGQAIRRSVTNYLGMPSSPAGKDARVVSIDVSTVDPRYASVRLTSKTAASTVMVLHHSFAVWWMQQVGASLRCNTAPKAVLTDMKIACRPPNGAVWISNCSRLESRPKTIVIACADGNYALIGLRWQTWGTRTATATGTARVNDCTPDCAGGHFHDYPVTATANALTKCGATPIYNQLTIAYRGSRPRSFARRGRHVLDC